MRENSPPPDKLVSALVTAGLSRATALAMAPQKAEEVLLLLRPGGARSGSTARRDLESRRRHPRRAESGAPD